VDLFQNLGNQYIPTILSTITEFQVSIRGMNSWPTVQETLMSWSCVNKGLRGVFACSLASKLRYNCSLLEASQCAKHI
jgi:hypothetical protein